MAALQAIIIAQLVLIAPELLHLLVDVLMVLMMMVVQLNANLAYTHVSLAQVALLVTLVKILLIEYHQQTVVANMASLMIHLNVKVIY